MLQMSEIIHILNVKVFIETGVSPKLSRKI